MGIIAARYLSLARSLPITRSRFICLVWCLGGAPGELLSLFPRFASATYVEWVAVMPCLTPISYKAAPVSATLMTRCETHIMHAISGTSLESTAVSRCVQFLERLRCSLAPKFARV